MTSRNGISKEMWSSLGPDAVSQSDEFSRNVHCVMGIPVDNVALPQVLARINEAAAKKTTLFISTPNLNFLVNSRRDSDFRDSLIMSDLCPVDGIAIYLIAKLIGVPVKNRLAGADLFEAIRAERTQMPPLKVFLFGGDEDVARAAQDALNDRPGGFVCVGSFFPGFGTVEEMSRSDIIALVNASDADFLAASLGAWKGQTWLLRNYSQLRIPVRVHLGAVLNFQAGTVRRAPLQIRRLGLEWVWRIKEEPYLWRRYWNDGIQLLGLLLTQALPLAVTNLYANLKPAYRQLGLGITESRTDDGITLFFRGVATTRNADYIVSWLRRASTSGRSVSIDVSSMRYVDTHILGLLLVLRKRVHRNGKELSIVGVSHHTRRIFRLNGLGFLLKAVDANMPQT